MQNKQGVTLIILVLTIIIMVILMSIIIVNGTSIFKDTKKSKLQMEIAQVESLTNTYVIRNSGNIDFVTVNFNTSGLSELELAQFANESIVDGSIQLYVIDVDKIDAEQLEYGNLKNGANDRYLYSLTTKKVYYEQGLEIYGQTYYRVDK